MSELWPHHVSSAHPNFITWVSVSSALSGADWKWKGFSTKVFKAALASKGSKMMTLKQASKEIILFLSVFYHWKKQQKTSKQVFKLIILLCRKIPRFWQIEIVSNFLISNTAENWEMQTFPMKKLSIFFSKSFKSHLLTHTHKKKNATIALFMENTHHLVCILKGDDSNEEATGHSNSSAGFMQKWEICG